MDEFRTIKQLKALLNDPAATPGEKANAQTILSRVMDKHGLTAADIADDTVTERRFAYDEDWQRRLLRQIVAMVTDDEPETYIERKQDAAGRWRLIKNQVLYKLTDEHYADVCEAYELYSMAYAIELDRLFGAFVQKHRLTRLSGEKVFITPEEYEAKYGLSGLNDVAKPGTKRLSDGS